eukprot:8547263-Heterocapsa_arctica.AAC.2
MTASTSGLSTWVLCAISVITRIISACSRVRQVEDSCFFTSSDTMDSSSASSDSNCTACACASSRACWAALSAAKHAAARRRVRSSAALHASSRAPRGRVLASFALACACC